MSVQSHHLGAEEAIGVVQIIFQRNSTAETGGFLTRLRSRPLWSELLHRAHNADILFGTSWQAHNSFFKNSGVQTMRVDHPNEELVHIVELVGKRSQLEQFINDQSELLTNAVVLFTSSERWEIT
jgi:PII-like signaling protein